jgi:MFS family permease
MERRLKELFYFVALFALAQALVTIFEPIFFYYEGISLTRIAFYYALHYTVYAFLLPLGAQFAARFGLEQSLALSTPLFVLYFLALAGIPQWPSLFWVALGLLTIHKIFYWPAWHSTFSQFGRGGSRGQELSFIFFVMHGVGVVGPLFGGLISKWLGFPALFLMAALVALISVLPLLRTRERFRAVSLAYLKPWRILADRRERRMVVGMGAIGHSLIHMFFWPVYMFIILGDTALLGALTFATSLVSTLTGLVVGKASDRAGARVVLRMQLPFAALSFLFRPLALFPVTVLLTDALARISEVGLQVPIYSHLHSRARSKGPLSYMTAAEMMLALAKGLTAWVLVWLFAVLLPYPAFILAFVLASALVWLYWWL